MCTYIFNDGDWPYSLSRSTMISVCETFCQCCVHSELWNDRVRTTRNRRLWCVYSETWICQNSWIRTNRCSCHSSTISSQVSSFHSIKCCNFITILTRSVHTCHCIWRFISFRCDCDLQSLQIHWSRIQAFSCNKKIGNRYRNDVNSPWPKQFHQFHCSKPVILAIKIFGWDTALLGVVIIPAAFFENRSK